MPEIEKCPCAGCRDKREARMRTELASQAAKIEAVRTTMEYGAHVDDCRHNISHTMDCNCWKSYVLAVLES